MLNGDQGSGSGGEGDPELVAGGVGIVGMLEQENVRESCLSEIWYDLGVI